VCAAHCGEERGREKGQNKDTLTSCKVLGLFILVIFGIFSEMHLRWLKVRDKQKEKKNTPP